jgi:nucleotide-binding universal stress UspA family protein
MSGIVVGVDSSHHAKLALEWAMKEAAVRDTPLTVLAVHKAVAGFYSSGVAYPGDDALTDKVGQAAQADVDAVAATLGDAGPKSVTVLAVNGVPAEALVKASSNADLLVLGSRGAGGFAQLTLGSVSTQVTHHSHCPVVIVPPADRH